MKSKLLEQVLSIAAAASFAAGLVLVLPGPAEATLASYRWRYSTVCVEDHINDGRWPGGQATERWNTVPDLKFVYRRDCGAYRQEIVLRSKYEGRNGRYGYAYVRYDGDRYITRATITMNDSYYGTNRMKYWSGRRAAIMHELGHVSGLKHTSYGSSLMNIYNFYKYSYPTAYDKREVERRYPW